MKRRPLFRYIHPSSLPYFKHSFPTIMQPLPETGSLFSKSPLWQLQRDYFEAQGIKAWQQGEVPHYVTSNPSVAKAYAEMVFGFFRDRVRLFPKKKETIYLVELVAGSGRVAFHFLNYFSSLCAAAAFKVPSWCYVLSDFTGSNVQYWQQHERLQPFVEKGVLDFAQFDAEKDASLQLVHAKKKIRKGDLAQPLVLIANYFFDGITQDLFVVKERQLHEVYATLRLPELPEDAAPAQMLEKLEIDYRQQRVKTASYYKEAGFNRVLREYGIAGQEAWVLFPHTGLRCLERLKKLSQEGFLLLSSDKGYHRLEDVQLASPPFIAKHGSFSLTVNYHAIGSFYRQQESVVLFTRHHHSSINVAAIVALPGAAAYAETAAAYDHFVERFGPDDFFAVKTHGFRSLPVMPLSAILGNLRLGGYDADMFKQCIPRLLNAAENMTAGARKDVQLMIRQVWDNYYPIGEKQDLAFDTGMLLYKIDAYPEALEFFERSLANYDAVAPVYYNMAACWFQLKDDGKTLEYVNKTLALEPGHEGAKTIGEQLGMVFEKEQTVAGDQ